MSDAPTRRHDLVRLGMAAGLGAMTILHVTQRRAFESMIPDWLPGSPVAWNGVATLAEGVSGALLARRHTARAGGWTAAATFATVFVANIDAVRTGGYPMFPGWFGTRQAAIARLPLQAPMVAGAMWVVRNTPTAEARR